jgi:hypothetical protein
MMREARAPTGGIRVAPSRSTSRATATLAARWVTMIDIGDPALPASVSVSGGSATSTRVTTDSVASARLVSGRSAVRRSTNGWSSPSGNRLAWIRPAFQRSQSVVSLRPVMNTASGGVTQSGRSG